MGNLIAYIIIGLIYLIYLGIKKVFSSFSKSLSLKKLNVHQAELLRNRMTDAAIPLDDTGSPTDPNTRTQTGMPLLSFIITNKDLNQSLCTQLTDMLIKQGADINAMSPDGNTPLHYAIMNNNDTYIRKLLRAGALLNAQNVEGKTPLFYVQTHFTMNFLLDWLQNMDQLQNSDAAYINIINIQDAKGKTLLNEYKAPAIIKYLLERGANPNIADDEGKTPIFYYLNNGKLRNLLIDKGAKLDVRDKEGRTLLFYTNDITLAKDLVKAGVDPAITDAQGKIAPIAEILNISTAASHSDKKDDFTLYQWGHHDDMIDRQTALETAMTRGLWDKAKDIAQRDDKPEHEYKFAASNFKEHPEYLDFMLENARTPADPSLRDAITHCDDPECLKRMLEHGAVPGRFSTLTAIQKYTSNPEYLTILLEHVQELDSQIAQLAITEAVKLDNGTLELLYKAGLKPSRVQIMQQRSQPKYTALINQYFPEEETVPYTSSIPPIMKK